MPFELELGRLRIEHHCIAALCLWAMAFGKPVEPEECKYSTMSSFE